MTGGLQTSGDGPVEKCRVCRRRPAAGPCARCRAPVCGDCSVLSEGGATTFAICVVCAEGGSDLRRPWLGLVLWVGGIVLALAAIAALLVLLRG
jgi:hypothetical protein